ncbi:MAG: ATP-binding protein [Bradymonadaceae bacterium]|nr:ATP-binding protein [Lujinxingiaceae bacterium]
MNEMLNLDDYKANCPRCDRKRYVTRAAVDVARADICTECFDVCPACNGEEYTFDRNPQGYSFVRNCPVCTVLRDRIATFNDARIPARYHAHGATLEEFQTDEPDPKGKARPVGNLPRVRLRLYKWTMGFVPGERGFLLHGEVGTGKTHLLAAVVRHLTLEKGIVARFVEFTHLLSEIREQFDQGRGESAILGPLMDVPVLAIDELGKGRNNEWQLSVIDEIISKRYNRGLTTLFTTNYPLDALPSHVGDTHSPEFRRNALSETLRERIGERIFSRLFEMSDFVAIEAPDYRKRKTDP